MPRAAMTGLVPGLALIVSVIMASRSASEAGSPVPVVLWAWERPEQLGFIDPERVEVAVLVGTLRLTPDSVRTRPRLQPLELPREARRIAVVRIESEHRPKLTPERRHQAKTAILAWTRGASGYDAVQIDFDATVSERPFYRQLLQDLRRELPQAMSISITALASWCLGDRWLEGLPIDEAVPMLFRMGLDEDAIRTALDQGNDFREPLCQTSYGLATDEPHPPIRSGRRLYLFHPKAWTEAAYVDTRNRLIPPGEAPS